VLEALISVKADVVLDRDRTGQQVVEVLIEGNGSFILHPSLKLSLRICLSFHSKAYDPLSLVFPTKMIGPLLFRKTLQFANAKFLPSKAQSKIPKRNIRFW
jgi:hypothetical protein